MAKTQYEEKILEFTKEFQVKVVELTDGPNVQIVNIADILGLHPMTIHRWRQEYRDGSLVYNRSNKISVYTDKREPYITKKELSEIKRLRSKNNQLQNEVKLLKSWKGHLSEYCQRSPSSESQGSLTSYF